MFSDIFRLGFYFFLVAIEWKSTCTRTHVEFYDSGNEKMLQNVKDFYPRHDRLILEATYLV